MRLIKSVLAGIVTLVLAVLAVWAGMFLMVSQVLPRWGEHPSGTGGIGFGSISLSGTATDRLDAARLRPTRIYFGRQMRRITSALFLASTLAASVYAQDAAAPTSPTFEVASVKRTVGTDSVRSGFIPTPGRFVAENVPAGTLIGFAYRDTVDDLRGVPAWAQSERYNVTATLPAQSSPSQVALMLRNLLVDRFRLTVHIERQERDVLTLIRSQLDQPLPSGFKRIDEDCTQPREPRRPPASLAQSETGEMPVCVTVNNGRTLNSGGAPMELLARQLRPLVGREVIDQTDLSGSYRFILRYSRTESGAPPPTDEYPDIITALREQLGLKLVPKKAIVNVLVVERFDRPTED